MLVMVLLTVALRLRRRKEVADVGAEQDRGVRGSPYYRCLDDEGVLARRQG